MNISQSQYNSGCESGWTHYLDQSYLSGSHGIQKGDDYVGTKPEFEEEEEEEDLSMVSDASSGPPHYQELYEDGCSFSVNSSASKLGKKSKKKKSKEQHHHLDDTASSSVFNYYSKKKMSTLSKNEPSMQNVLDYSEGFSTTHMKGKSALLQHFGYLNSSLAPQNLVIFKEEAGSNDYDGNE
ncbi:protein SOB FIVE-LIKE 5-like isoform X1 [Rosa rugosa]|uniref:protein SOB FIVE-LIKE 5-like isoform X1 n=1 Tax=Rosa rugosa TaxID=74645 RepID=UPI002B417233|nr:protein SOB FIVE-LIKE 5-like isoform X1 [Rosa rugosa]